MAKCIDITDKLNFEASPEITIKGIKVQVDDSAATVLKVMGMVGDGSDITPDTIKSMYECIFPEGERKKLEKLKLNFSDLQTVIMTAIELITGEVSRGE